MYEEDKYKYCCVICKKKYNRKSSLDKHLILCNFKTKSKREKLIELEEFDDIPTHHQLVQIVQELTIKITKMEDKIQEMNKFIDKKKRKIDITSWLDNNIQPTVGFLEWINSYIIVKPEHFENLLYNDIFVIIQQIFEYNLSLTDFIYPIYCFTQKDGTFYICNKSDDGTSKWVKSEFTDLILILKTIVKQLYSILTKWKEENQNNFNDNNKLAILFNEAIIKLTKITLKQDNSFGKIRNNLYNYLKKDLQIIMEVEFN